VSEPVTIAVLAKAPEPGRVKTRLCPPCSHRQAASIARAALEDTVAAALAVPVARRVLVLDGDPAGWTDLGIEVLPQRGRGLDERLAAAFADIGGRTLLIGMDTPQLTIDDLAHAAGVLASSRSDAVLGPAHDGGYWAIGLPGPNDGAFIGVPMSAADTGAAQLTRLRHLGHAVHLLEPRLDVDRWDDALAVAAAAPGTRFGRAVTAVAATLEPAGPS
jgi:rSAM/selenodomain-associated transferase 1